MRNNDIITTLRYVELKRQELLSLMFEAKLNNSTLKNSANLVADILANLTKCFDYCANDIYEKYIISKLSQKEKKRVKIYFPFYLKQLNDKKNPFSLLLIHKKIIYNFLVELIQKIDNQETIENTLLQYSIIREVRYLMNNDKHNKIIEVDNQGRMEVVAESSLGKITIPEAQLAQNGWHFEVFPNQTKKEVITKSYRLVENNKDIADFCSDAQWSSQKVLDQIYRKFLGSKII